MLDLKIEATSPEKIGMTLEKRSGRAIKGSPIYVKSIVDDDVSFPAPGGAFANASSVVGKSMCRGVPRPSLRKRVASAMRRGLARYRRRWRPVLRGRTASGKPR